MLCTWAQGQAEKRRPILLEFSGGPRFLSRDRCNAAVHGIASRHWAVSRDFYVVEKQCRRLTVHPCIAKWQPVFHSTWQALDKNLQQMVTFAKINLFTSRIVLSLSSQMEHIRTSPDSRCKERWLQSDPNLQQLIPGFGFFFLSCIISPLHTQLPLHLIREIVTLPITHIVNTFQWKHQFDYNERKSPWQSQTRAWNVDYYGVLVCICTEHGHNTSTMKARLALGYISDKKGKKADGEVSAFALHKETFLRAHPMQRRGNTEFDAADYIFNSTKL